MLNLGLQSFVIRAKKTIPPPKKKITFIVLALQNNMPTKKDIFNKFWYYKQNSILIIDYKTPKHL